MHNVCSLGQCQHGRQPRTGRRRWSPARGFRQQGVLADNGGAAAPPPPRHAAVELRGSDAVAAAAWQQQRQCRPWPECGSCGTWLHGPIRHARLAVNLACAHPTHPLPQGVKNVPKRLRIVVQRKRAEDDEDSVSQCDELGVRLLVGIERCGAQAARRQRGPATAEGGSGMHWVRWRLRCPARPHLALPLTHHPTPGPAPAGGDVLSRDSGRGPDDQEGRGGAGGMSSRTAAALTPPPPV